MRRPRSPRQTTSRLGISRIEVVIFGLAIMTGFAYSVLGIHYARERARNNMCMEHLRTSGVAMQTFADSDPQHRLCSGAYDWMRDGCPSKYGWVADMVNTGSGDPQQMHCPASDALGSDTLNDLLSFHGGPPANIPTDRPDLIARLTEDLCGSTRAHGKLATDFLDLGYGTNYAASWHLVRSRVLLWRKVNGDTANDPYWDARSLGGAYGPLTVSLIETSPIPYSTIPLLGCSGSRTTLTGDVPGYLNAGAPLGQSFNNGPSYWNDATNEITLIPKGQLLTESPTGTGICAWCDDVLPTFGAAVPQSNIANGGSDGLLWLQDTRAWSGVHWVGKNFTCNILMADGSVKSIADLNDDGYLNPGFPVIGGDESVGYRDSLVELFSFEIYCGASIEAEQNWWSHRGFE